MNGHLNTEQGKEQCHNYCNCKLFTGLELMIDCCNCSCKIVNVSCNKLVINGVLI